MSPYPTRLNFKTLLRFGLILAVAFFLGRTLWQNWQAIAQVPIAGSAWGWLTIALCCSLVAHAWAGALWAAILRVLSPRSGDRITSRWGIQVYLRTNLAKYLPGNVWHFYGRFNACKAVGIPAGEALLGILLEPLLMAAAGLVVAIGPLLLQPTPNGFRLVAQILALGAVLIGIHPNILNPVLRKVGGAKRQRLAIDQIPQLQRYPLKPLIGELGFVLLRGTGFALTWHSIHGLTLAQLPWLYSSFAIAWLLGLIAPGLPGGIGIFEAVILALLSHELSPAALIVIVALYRVVNTLAEAIGALLAWRSPKSESP
jgi:glycosyltransferase 2 family protein